jgi:hypothetical protein
MPALGEIDRERGEFWVENPFDITSSGENLSAYEKNRIYLSMDGESFMDVSYASGVDLDSDSRSVICADFDNDGAEDILVASVGGGPLRLFVNSIPQIGKRVRLDLRGTKSNRQAIGTRVVLHVGDRRIVRDNFPTNGFMGQSPVEMIVGVGEAEKIDAINVRWPTGETQRFGSLPVDAIITITEGQEKAVVGDFP